MASGVVMQYGRSRLAYSHSFPQGVLSLGIPELKAEQTGTLRGSGRCTHPPGAPGQERFRLERPPPCPRHLSVLNKVGWRLRVVKGYADKY